MTDLRVFAVVPARGGSKGIPRKNLRTVGGQSLVARAVAAANDSTYVTDVAGSTDDDEIAEALGGAGALVIKRPASLALDDTPDVPVFLHALDFVAARGIVPDIVVNVRPTAPLRTGADIDAAIELLLASPAARSVKSVSPVTEHPYKMWTVVGALLEPIRPDWLAAFGGDPDISRHELPAVYRSNGAVDAVWRTALQETGRFHPGPVASFVMPSARMIDVDVEDDLLAAEQALQEDQR